MAFAIPAWLVTVNQSHNGKPMANVICVTRPSATGIDELAVASDVATAWCTTDSFIDCQVQDWLYTNIAVRRLDVPTDTVIVENGDSGMEDNGNVVGDPVDPGSCLGFSLRTGVAGKSNRGRIYLGGVGRGALDSFSTAWDFTTSPGSTFVNAADVFQGALEGGSFGFSWAVYSRLLQSTRHITSVVARSSILSQNPRARRYGVV